MPEGAKFDGIPSTAGWLHICALAYAARTLTDGFIPAGRIYKLTNDPPRVVEQAVKWLTTARPGCEYPLWERAEGGWQIHDYTDPEYNNPTREDTSNARRQKAEAGRIGGQRSVERRRERYGTAQPPLHSNSEPTHAEATGTSTTDPSNSVPEADPEALASKLPEAPREAESKLPSTPLPSPPLPSLPNKEGASTSEALDQVFQTWLSSLPTGARRDFTTQRRSVIRAALNRADLADCLDAVKGWRWDTWEGRLQNNDLEDCLRPKNLEKFRDWERGINRPAPRAQAANGRPRSERDEIPTRQELRDLSQELQAGALWRTEP